MRIEVLPCTIKEANYYIEKHHRHHKKVQGHRFSLKAVNKEEIVGVIVVGRPVARMTNQETVAEVTRLCTNGTKNVCSKLYSAAARVCKEMGFASIQTFILESETGISLIASGWKLAGVSGGGSWNRENRTRTDKHPTEKKLKFEKRFK